MSAANRLSALEADFLAHLSARSRQVAPGPDYAFADLNASEVRVAKRLIKKGFADGRGTEKYGITQAGVDRAKQIY